MNDTIRITCPTCCGAQTVTQRHPSGDQQLETDIPCTHPDCHEGTIEVGAAEIDNLVARARIALGALAVVSVRDPKAVPTRVVSDLSAALRDLGVEF